MHAEDFGSAAYVEMLYRYVRILICNLHIDAFGNDNLASLCVALEARRPVYGVSEGGEVVDLAGPGIFGN